MVFPSFQMMQSCLPHAQYFKQITENKKYVFLHFLYLKVANACAYVNQVAKKTLPSKTEVEKNCILSILLVTTISTTKYLITYVLVGM